MEISGLEPGWPRRLLHVPSMTSLEKQDGHIYGNDKEPAYNILSYTWGRWEVPQGNSALMVHGVPWTIPAVDESHFSVTELKKVISRISLGSNNNSEG